MLYILYICISRLLEEYLKKILVARNSIATVFFSLKFRYALILSVNFNRFISGIPLFLISAV